MSKKPNIQIWPIDKIVPYPQNVKDHPPAQVKQIAASIREFGWSQPIVVDKDGVIIAGHGRRKAALHLELTEVPVWVRDDLDEHQVRALRLIDNRVAEGGTLNTELMRLELSDLEFDLGDWFSAKELDFSMADLGEMSDGAFVDDIGAAVDAQADGAREKAAAVQSKPVPIAKILGFKTVGGEHQITINRWMAGIEERTGLKGEAAFVAFAASAIE